LVDRKSLFSSSQVEAQPLGEATSRRLQPRFEPTLKNHLDEIGSSNSLQNHHHNFANRSGALFGTFPTANPLAILLPPWMRVDSLFLSISHQSVFPISFRMRAAEPLRIRR
jgi:hypothetical protein